MDCIAIDRIKVGKRARKSVGDTKSLRASIERVGILHPLVLNSRHELIAGMRRLTVAKELGWKTVPAVTVDTLDDAVLALVAERDENTDRRPLAASEIVTLGKQIEALEKPKADERKAASRAKKGQKVGKAQGEGTGSLTLKQGKKGKTSDKVGEAVGVSGKTYEQAKVVTEKGTPELVAAMDDKTLSVKVAAQIAELPPETQQAVLAAPDPKEAATKAIEEAAKHTDEGEAFVKEVETLCYDTDKIVARMKALKSSRFAYSINIDSSVSQVEAARKTFWQGRPAHPCPYCSGEGCKACAKTGRVKKSTFDAGKDAMGGGK